MKHSSMMVCVMIVLGETARRTTENEAISSASADKLLTAKKIVLLNEKGENSIVLDGGKSDGGTLAFLDSTGVRRIVIRGEGLFSPPAIELRDESNRPTLSLSASESGDFFSIFSINGGLPVVGFSRYGNDDRLRLNICAGNDVRATFIVGDQAKDANCLFVVEIGGIECGRLIIDEKRVVRFQPVSK